MAPRTKPVLAAAVLLLMAACGGSDTEATNDPGGGTSATVTTKNFAFSPTTIEAESGDTLAITVTNSDDVQHTFTIDDADIDVVVEPGASGETQVTVGETALAFRCRFHPQMTGTIGSGTSDAGDTGSKQGEGDDDLDY